MLERGQYRPSLAVLVAVAGNSSERPVLAAVGDTFCLLSERLESGFGSNAALILLQSSEMWCAPGDFRELVITGVSARAGEDRSDLEDGSSSGARGVWGSDQDAKTEEEGLGLDNLFDNDDDSGSEGWEDSLEDAWRVWEESRRRHTDNTSEEVDGMPAVARDSEEPEEADTSLDDVAEFDEPLGASLDDMAEFDEPTRGSLDDVAEFDEPVGGNQDDVAEFNEVGDAGSSATKTQEMENGVESSPGSPEVVRVRLRKRRRPSSFYSRCVKRNVCC